MIDIMRLTKGQLIDVCRQAGVKVGDYARNSRDYYLQAVLAMPGDVVQQLVGQFPASFPPIEAAPAIIASVPAYKPAAQQPTVVRRASCKEVFGFALTDVMDQPLMVDIWNDPDAPAPNAKFKFNKAHLQKVVVAMNSGGNAWLSGPKGTGKTEFVLQFAARLGRSVARVNFDASSEKYEFLGGERVRGGSSVWQDGAILCGMKRAGCIILLDEVARCRPEYLMALNPLLEPAGKITITETGDVVCKAPGVFYIAADNSNGMGDPSGEYVCRKVDGSLQDRFDAMVEFSFFEPMVEAEIIVDVVGCPMSLAVELVRFAGVCRTAASGGNIESAPGLRMLFAFARAIMGGIAPREAFCSAIANKAGSESVEELQQLFKANLSPPRLIAAARDALEAYELGEAAKVAALEAASVAAAAAAGAGVVPAVA